MKDMRRCGRTCAFEIAFKNRRAAGARRVNTCGAWVLAAREVVIKVLNSLMASVDDKVGKMKTDEVIIT